MTSTHSTHSTNGDKDQTSTVVPAVMTGGTHQLLPYELTVFTDLQVEDGLVITAKGLGIERIVLNLLRIYCEPNFLVVVLNTTTEEEDLFMDELKSFGVPQLPKVITNEYGTNERESVYLKGGVLFITSRILVVDMLTNRLPVHLLTGIIVYRAHRIVDSGQEAFILRLYRQKNKTGFIKAFSDSPTSFISGFFQVEKVMRNLFLRKLYLWPRFHASVTDILEKYKPDVVEINVELTPLMTSVQMALLDLIGCCLRELRRSYHSLDPDELTVENCIDKSFDKFLRSQLDPVWHQLPSKTRQLVSDLSVLRTLMQYLTQYDAVTFYAFLESLRANEKNSSNPSLWFFMDAANTLFVHARARIYNASKEKSKQGSKKRPAENLQESTDEIEESPKWEALSQVLQEIKNDSKEAGIEGKTLIAASDERTCSQLREYLCNGGRQLLNNLYQKSFVNKDEELPGFSTSNNKRVDNKRNPKNGHSHNDNDFKIEILSHCLTVIHPLRGNSDPYSLLKTLTEHVPDFIVLYDVDIQFVRQIEVFKASRPDMALRVYFIIFSGSVEEQRYLTTLRKEKEAFEILIKQKATMVIPEEREGKGDLAPELLRGCDKASEAVNSRKAGGKAIEEPVRRKIIVDLREFRSELPSLIHKRGIDIEPLTLEVGDYILSPDICVERKSVSDLIGSLNNGRLYNQALAMTRFYKKPVLLIEFDQNKPFSLQAKSSLGKDISIQTVSSKLSLLTIHFPKLRIIWTQSPYATAEIFEDLKSNYPDPDPDIAMSVGINLDEVATNMKYNIGPQDFIRKMPGVNSKNYRYILNNVNDISDLATRNEEEFLKLLGNEKNAKLLHQFIHKNNSSNDDKQR